MQLKELGVVIPTDPHNNIAAAINAAQQSPGAAVWIPAWYTGGDSVPANPGVPTFDLRGLGSFSGSGTSGGVSPLSYGAKWDVQFFGDATFTNGRTTITCPDCNFTKSDVGKIAFATA